MMKTAVVAGHLCLDVLPDLRRVQPGKFLDLFHPGQLIQAGPARFATGGPVSNTGLALHRLGIPTCLMAKTGQDFFGGIVRSLIGQIDPSLVGGIATNPSSDTSYSVVINPPGFDRIFLHCPGANDTFTAADIDYCTVERSSLFHFGYPPIMRRMYQDDGAELESVLRLAKQTGTTTSLDMAFPDPSSESGMADWNNILARALPYTDIFLPSVGEIVFMLRRADWDRFELRGGVEENITLAYLDDLAGQLLGMGAKIVGLKLGTRGFYLRISEHLAKMGRAEPSDRAAWEGKAIYAPCFEVDVVGTTGSGDATIAGFLAALLRDLTAERAADMAVAVGACNVEAADALSGIRGWEETVARVRNGWPRKPKFLG